MNMLCDFLDLRTKHHNTFVCAIFKPSMHKPAAHVPGFLKLLWFACQCLYLCLCLFVCPFQGHYNQ